MPEEFSSRFWPNVPWETHPHCFGATNPCWSDLEQIKELYQTWIEELRTFFEEHKGKCGIPEHETHVYVTSVLLGIQEVKRASL
jgi:hypothetical protein